MEMIRESYQHLCKKPSQKKTEETEILDNFGLESATVGS